MGGKGHGLGLSLTQRHHNWYIKTGLMAEAGALIAIYISARWPGDRLAQEGIPGEHKCLLCHEEE
eukprot:3380625-Karenia_brevis.AAC.1